MSQLKLHLIGYDSAWGSRDPGCADGPAALDLPGLAARLAAEVPGLSVTAAPALGLSALADRAVLQDKTQTFPYILESRKRLMSAVQGALRDGAIPVVIGGDHSCAAGTWPALAHGLDCVCDFDLFWIDAHMDSHTPATAHEGKWGGWWHGMPVACLIGEGPEGMTDGRVLDPQFLHMIGIRSYEPGEDAFLKRHRVAPVMADRVLRDGFGAVWAEQFSPLSASKRRFGISIDLDSFDPAYAPGVGSPEVDGLKPAELCIALAGAGRCEGFMGIEIVEYNPHNDAPDRRTAALVPQILASVFAA